MEWKKEYQGQVIKTRVGVIPVSINTATEDCSYWSQFSEMSEFIEQKKVSEQFKKEVVEVEKEKVAPKKRKAKGVI